MPTIERPDPPYLQIASNLRERIISGELSDGDPIPSARQITRDWGVAMATATKVLATLRSEGLVRAVPGIGTVVTSRESLHAAAGDRSSSIARRGRIYPPGHYARILSCELTTASEEVADALGLEPRSQVVRRDRTVYDDQDSPLSTSISWFDGSLIAEAPLLLTSERIPQGSYAYVATQLGRRYERALERFAARRATAVVAAQLRVDEGSPVLATRTRFLDDRGDVLEYGESYALPDHWVFVETPATSSRG